MRRNFDENVHSFLCFNFQGNSRKKFHTISSTHQDLKFHTAETKFFHSDTLGVGGHFPACLATPCHIPWRKSAPTRPIPLSEAFKCGFRGHTQEHVFPPKNCMARFAPPFVVAQLVGVGFWQNGFFCGFLLGRWIFSRILAPDSFSSFLWGKSAQKIYQENPWQNPPKCIQQKSPTPFCRGAVPKLVGRVFL